MIAIKEDTSFAGVDVVPLIEHSEEIHIQEDEIRVDVYRSSALVVNMLTLGFSCSNNSFRIRNCSCLSAERSQLQNKNRALELLKTKLILKQKEEEL